LILFFPPHFFETTMLKEGKDDHRHERVPVKALPGSSFEVVEAEFLFREATPHGSVIRRWRL
jgi:hypothetical protein